MSAMEWYCSVVPLVFTYKLPELRVSFVLWDLLRSFEVMRSLTLVGPPS